MCMTSLSYFFLVTLSFSEVWTRSSNKKKGESKPQEWPVKLSTAAHLSTRKTYQKPKDKKTLH